jgi:hypothetical protein
LHTDAVVELADFVKVKQDIVGPSVEGTQNVIPSVKKNAVERFVMVSSVAAIISLNKPAEYGIHSRTQIGTNGVRLKTVIRMVMQRLMQKDWFGVKRAKLIQQQLLLFRSIRPLFLGPCLNESRMNYSTPKLVKDVLVGNSPPVDVPFSFVDVRDDVAKGAVCAFTMPKDTVSV